MFNYEDIYNMMKCGDSAEDIAKRFTDNLNKAQKAIDDEAAKAKKAAAEKAANAEKERQLLTNLTAALNAYGAFKFGITENEYLTTKDVAAIVDESYKALSTTSKVYTKAKDFINKMFPDAEVKVDAYTLDKDGKATRIHSDDADEDIIYDFLDRMFH